MPLANPKTRQFCIFRMKARRLMKARFVGDGLGLPLISGTLHNFHRHTAHPQVNPNLKLVVKRRFVLPHKARTSQRSNICPAEPARPCACRPASTGTPDSRPAGRFLGCRHACMLRLTSSAANLLLIIKLSPAVARLMTD